MSYNLERETPWLLVLACDHPARVWETSYHATLEEARERAQYAGIKWASAFRLGRPLYTHIFKLEESAFTQGG